MGQVQWLPQILPFSAHVTQYTIAPLIHRPQMLPSGDAGTRCPDELIDDFPLRSGIRRVRFNNIHMRYGSVSW